MQPCSLGIYASCGYGAPVNVMLVGLSESLPIGEQRMSFTYSTSRSELYSRCERVRVWTLHPLVRIETPEVKRPHFFCGLPILLLQPEDYNAAQSVVLRGYTSPSTFLLSYVYLSHGCSSVPRNVKHVLFQRTFCGAMILLAPSRRVERQASLSFNVTIDWGLA
jgi:hypothetical protein